MGTSILDRWLGRPLKPALGAIAEQHPAEPKDAESQFNLARQFAGGEGVVQDYAHAAEWYLKAAGQDHCAAQFNLGLMYRQGQGVLRNEVTAGMWLRKAAELGHAEAQYHVGVKQHCTSKGELPPEASECRIEAFKWLKLAVEQGNHGAESALEFVALGMTVEELGEGGRRAVAFRNGQIQQGTAT